jgi:DNA polymerase I-like protein with 3'-5' exonuclease and polymerase domains
LITKQNRKDIQKQAMAFIPQSTASDINLIAGTRLRMEHGLHVIIPVHDSTLVECPIEDREDVARLMKDVMEETAREVYSDRVAFPVDVEFGSTWGDLS